jgi:hypothetical protein
VGGEDSWHPASPSVSACTGVDHGRPMVQAACSERHTIAANAATLTVNWTIERMPMRQLWITSVGNSILPVSITLLAAEQSSFLNL